MKIYLDLASVSGICLGTPLNFKAKSIDFGEKKPLPHRLHEFHRWLSIQNADSIMVEKCFSRGKNDAPVLYGLHAILEYFCYLHDIPIEKVEPSALKKWLTGKGNASKPMMMETLYSKYGIVEHDHNRADAIALMLFDCKPNPNKVKKAMSQIHLSNVN